MLQIFPFLRSLRSYTHRSKWIRIISCMLRTYLIYLFLAHSLVSEYQYLLFENRNSLWILNGTNNVVNCQQDKFPVLAARRESNYREKKNRCSVHIGIY